MESKNKEIKDRGVILALDGLSAQEAMRLVGQIGKQVYAVKIHELLDQFGPQAIHDLKQRGVKKVWVDYKLHDIPRTVERRAKALKANGADILTVMADGGIDMMYAAMQSGATIFAVTELTSLSEEEIHLRSGHPSKASVLAKARAAALAGVHGLVCSPKEVGTLSNRPELEVLDFVTPGVRLEGSDHDDQKRVGTPYATIKDGARFLVCGSEFVKSEDPLMTLKTITEQMLQGLEDRYKKGENR